MKDYCFYHPNIKGVDICDKCDRTICEEDKIAIFSNSKGMEVNKSGIKKTYCFICYLDSKCHFLERKRLESNQMIFFISTFFVCLPLIFTLYNIIDANKNETPDFIFPIIQSLVFLTIPIIVILREVSISRKASTESKVYLNTKKEFLCSLSEEVQQRYKLN